MPLQRGCVPQFLRNACTSSVFTQYVQLWGKAVLIHHSSYTHPRLHATAFTQTGVHTLAMVLRKPALTRHQITLDAVATSPRDSSHSDVAHTFKFVWHKFGTGQLLQTTIAVTLPCGLAFRLQGYIFLRTAVNLHSAVSTRSSVYAAHGPFLHTPPHQIFYTKQRLHCNMFREPPPQSPGSTHLHRTRPRHYVLPTSPLSRKLFSPITWYISTFRVFLSLVEATFCASFAKVPLVLLFQ